MPRVPSRALIAAAALTAACAAAAPAALAADYAGTARNVIPSGQYGGIPVPAGADEQAKMYDALTPLFDKVTSADLVRTFKSAKLGGDDSAAPYTPEAVPRAGVTLKRDRFNVPYIEGKTRDDVTWAMGWVLQEDRGLLLAQGRYPGRVAALDVPNLNAFGLVVGLKRFTPTAAVDAAIERRGLRALRSEGRDGAALLHDIDVFIEGINARLAHEGSAEKPFTRADLFAVNALIGQLFGEGGGAEPPRAELLDGLRDRLGKRRAQVLFDDLSERDDPDHPATLTKRFEYNAVPRASRRTGAATVDDGSYEPVQAAQGEAPKRAQLPPHASNFLMLGAKRSTNGHPIFVAGPQVGYFYPGLTLEADIKGPGYHARGAYSPANAGNMLIARGEDFAWSLTSAGSDLIDVYAETLCGGSARKYRYKGKCRSMKRTKAGVLDDAGEVVFDSTVHGPVVGYARSNGKRIALARKRSSYGRDILFQLPFRDATLGKVRSTRTFYKAFSRSPYTFNVAYADDRDIAMYSAGRLPERDPRVDPRLPTKGDGRFEWKGFLSDDEHAHQANPSTGELVNWNNQPAPGWGASDENYSYGSAHRVQLLERNLDKRRRHSPASVVGAMNAAATTDLRTIRLTPTLRRLLRGTKAPSARAQAALDALETWRRSGGSRLDRDLDGVIDAGAGPVVMDELYPRLLTAVLRPRLGKQLNDLLALVGNQNSAQTDFTGGGIWYLDKDLRTLAGQRVARPYRTAFCGKGSKARCRTALWDAIEDAAAAIAGKQGEDPAAWKADATAERITFAPGLLQTSIRYTNRPSGIQQVMSFTGHRPRR